MSCACGFESGDRVRMTSSLTRIDGSMVGTVHGMVKPYPYGDGCCHVVAWDETDCLTALPNPNVERDDAR